MAFLSGALGNPSRAALRVAGQATLDRPPTPSTVWRDFRSNNNPFSPEVTTVTPLAITQGGAPLQQLPGKSLIGEVDLELTDTDPADYGLIHSLANLFGVYELTSAAFEQWQFDLAQTASTADPYLYWLADNDIHPRSTIFDSQIKSMVVTAEQGGNFQVVNTVLAGQYHYFGDVTQTAGAGSTLPEFKRTYAGVWSADADDQDIFVLMEDVTGLPTSVDIQFKLGAAAAYSPIVTYTIGDTLRVTDEAGNRVGASGNPVGEQVRFHIPASPAPTLVLNDEFQAPRRVASRWTQTLATPRPIPAVNTEVLIDGVATRFEGGFNFTIDWESAELLGDTPGQQPGTPSRKGNLIATLELTREISDLVLQAALHQQTEVAVILNALTDARIGATAQEYLFRAVFPAVRPSGRMFQVDSGAESREEVVTMIAGVPASPLVYDGDTYASHAGILLRNDVSGL